MLKCLEPNVLITGILSHVIDFPMSRGLVLHNIIQASNEMFHFLLPLKIEA